MHSNLPADSVTAIFLGKTSANVRRTGEDPQSLQVAVRL